MRYVSVSTLGNIRLVARHTPRSPDGGASIEFHTERGDLVASCPVGSFSGRVRFLPLKVGEPDWELGPVDTALVKSLLTAAS